MADGDDNLQQELASFRQKWKEEINNKQSTNSSNNVSPDDDSTSPANQEKTNDSIEDEEKLKEEKAAKLFLEGVKLERKKLVYEAIEFYKKAVRLVPDIESRISEYASKIDYQSEDEESDEEDELENDCDTETNASLGWVTKKFKVLGVGGLCTPLHETKQTHISVLPTELLIYIFRWVVSNELDLRSLEQLSQVCKWFYACARDESVWKSACIRIWSVNCGHPTAFGGCWRRMLLERPRLNFNGVYINKNSYVRTGEESLDGFYRPYHLVEYYRYLRFYVDGTVLVSTTAEDPLTVIPTLRRKQVTTTTTIKGHYRMLGDTVSIVTKRTQKNQSESRNRRSRGQANCLQEQVFHMDLKLKSSGKKRNNQLIWMDYSYKIHHKSSGHTFSNQIDVTNYKPFYFSRVKRFHSSSKLPL